MVGPSTSLDYGRSSTIDYPTITESVTEVTQEVAVAQQPRLMAVQVPPGAQPGMMLQVQARNGQMLQVQIPMGAAAGAQFQVALP